MSLFGSILPGRGDTFAESEEEAAGDDGDSGTEEAELSGTYAGDSEKDSAENPE